MTKQFCVLRYHLDSDVISGDIVFGLYYIHFCLQLSVKAVTSQFSGSTRRICCRFCCLFSRQTLMVTACPQQWVSLQTIVGNKCCILIFPSPDIIVALIHTAIMVSYNSKILSYNPCPVAFIYHLSSLVSHVLAIISDTDVSQCHDVSLA